MYKLVLMFTVVFLSTTAFAKAPVITYIESSETITESPLEGQVYMDLVNEQFRAGKVLYDILGHDLTPEIGKKIDKIVCEESNQLYKENNSSKAELHRRVDARMHTLAHEIHNKGTVNKISYLKKVGSPDDDSTYIPGPDTNQGSIMHNKTDRI